jgi:GNAT superfamily N-acetyltransferase
LGKLGILSSMYTKAPFRRRGIAKALLTRVVEEASALGCECVQITASAMGVSLYEDFGFMRYDRYLQYVFHTGESAGAIG